MSDETNSQQAAYGNDEPVQSGQNLLDVEVEYDQCVNYAVQQNAVPVIKRITLTNPTPVPYADLLVRITSDPDFCEPWESRIASLEANQKYRLDRVDISLSSSFLAELRERTAGHIKIDVSSGASSLSSVEHPIELLAYDEWPGARSIPEMLAAFVMPNHPAVEPILKEAASVLKTWTEDSSLSGYQTGNPKRVWQTVAALYAALRKLGISYINPPASFEAMGQKVRTPDRIVETRLGTCLDLSLLCASCIEAAGLNPIIAIQNGHAYPGAWLKNETFSPATVDELQPLRKRADLGEIVVFESTSLTSDGVRDFNQAVLDAAPKLKMDEEFIVAIDIASARKALIRPLPLRAHGMVVAPKPEEESRNDTTDTPPEIPKVVEEQGETGDEVEAPGQTRVDQWKRKLLDLSLRNRLLNFRDTQKSVPILCPDLPALEDALAADAVFTFAPALHVMSGGDPRDAAVYQMRSGEDAQQEFLREEMASKRLHTGLSEFEMNKRLLETYRAARTAQEEGGANVCYLALGFLEWTQPDNESQVYSAPLLLLPVELTRKSIQQGFRLQEHDDEPRINITLLQMLERDFGLSIPWLDPLPRDSSGIDVQAVLQTFRTAVRDIKGWEIKNTVRLGLFSFTKYLMWKDLEDRTEDLMQNSVVEHLIKNPETPYPMEGEMPDPDRIDEELLPSNMYCPRDADSSQLASVMAASNGKSFVMEGPPGTGKSQTITNIIAQCLAEGKTVLFVAEKMAALSVVYDRLSGVGLAPYCLELHSSKAKKSDVLRQLGEAASRVPADIETEWKELGGSVGSLRAELNQYVRLLHKTHPNGLTAFTATSTLVSLREEPVVALRWSGVDIHTRADLQNLKSAVEELATAADACGAIAGNPWSGFEHTDWSPGWAQEVESRIDELAGSIEKLDESFSGLASRFGIERSGLSLAGLKRIDSLGAVMLRSPGAPKTMLEVGDWEDFKIGVEAVAPVGRARDALRAKLFSEYSAEIESADIAGMTATWKSAEQVLWPLSWIRRHKVKSLLKGFHKERKAPVNEKVSGILSDAGKLQELQHEVAAGGASVGTVLGRLWRAGYPDWDEVDAVCKWTDSFRQAVFSASDADASKMSAMYRQLSDTIALANDQLHEGGQIGNVILSSSRCLADFEAARHALSVTGGVNEATVWGDENDLDVTALGRNLVARCKPAIGSLRYWCAWQLSRSNAVALGLAPLVEGIEGGTVKAEGLQKTFRKSYCQWWLNTLTNQEPLLRQFLREAQEKKIKRFAEADVAFIEKTKGVVAARLSSSRPSLSSASANGLSELGLLSKELRRRRRHMPVRTLLARIPNLLPRLKPCLLMSPLSVSQYLEAGKQPFDVVIFDEASQIPVWDAVGAIARGKQVIIAGDPKQLPPTNFFMKAQEDDDISEEDVKVEDLESILDECLGAGLPKMPLNWHYRSRHESLIAFSNFQYYENSLQTFPSSETADNAVSFSYVSNAVYDKGKSRTNREEARALVSEVVSRLSDPSTRQQTIGIVTFNQAQQILIEDMLENERLLHPEIEKYFAPDIGEPVFVKNLENVQGDERDVIFFSICYGRDINGKVSHNFGPMNKDGGERRLNVAVTRARSAVRVFSSITSDEIDLRKTQSRGVSDLKLFLEYAQRGPATLSSSVSRGTEADFDSPFEKQVHDALAKRGWESDLQVGCSGYRIDLGIVDKRHPGRYLAGIECDGANYHSAKSARDRDRLRQAVLEGLGWKLIRIWSTDWWFDPQRELDRVDRSLHALEEGGLQDEQNSDDDETERGSTDNHTTVVPDDQRLAVLVSQPTGVDESYPSTYYSIFSDVPDGAFQGNFYEQYQSRTIREMILKIIEVEGPISLEMLVRRVAALWGFSRAGNAIRGRVIGLIRGDGVMRTKHNGTIWYWPPKQNPDRYSDFRVPSPDESESRDIVDIAPEEIGNASLSILRQHISIDADELARQVSRVFGYSRLAAASKAHTDYSIDLLIKKGLARRDGDMVVIEK